MRPTTRILLVADAPALVHALQSQLRQWDYQITGVAESTETALALTQTLSPNLVLIDLDFQGGRSGLEIAERIRSESGIPVVFLSSHADRETLKAAQATYPFGYLREPFSETEVRSTIEIALSKHQAERAI